ncbi:hypothetical protein MRB53_041459 [Persea americana]|nr:hypothetical protein MRB53_041459 [Persea americana]
MLPAVVSKRARDFAPESGTLPSATRRIQDCALIPSISPSHFDALHSTSFTLLTLLYGRLVFTELRCGRLQRCCLLRDPNLLSTRFHTLAI